MTDQQRQLGKTLNFGIVYGQTAHGLARTSPCPSSVPKPFWTPTRKPILASQPGLPSPRAGSNTGEVRTLYGRRRYLPNIYSASPADAAEARRQAVNTIIQGTAADLLKLALIRLHDALPDEVRMLLPVHDSVLFQVREPLLEAPARSSQTPWKACQTASACRSRSRFALAAHGLIARHEEPRSTADFHFIIKM